jgi:hypothetical protein
MKHITDTMALINTLTDNIYEDLFDKDYVSLNSNLSELILLLKDIQSSTKSEQ